MTLLTIGSLIIFISWKTLNIHQSYIFNQRMTPGNIWDIFFSLLMCYWLIIPSVMFLIAKIFDGLFALGLGIYLALMPTPDNYLIQKNNVINGYWSYAITDTAICVICFFISFIGNHGSYV